MSTKSLLTGCAIGCAVVVFLLVVGGYLAYRHYLAPQMARMMAEMQSVGEAVVVKGADFLEKTIFLSDERLSMVTDIALGNFTGQPGADIGVASPCGALFLDDDHRVKSRVQFQTYSPGADLVDHVDIVDVEGDGVCEFINRGSWSRNPSLIDHAGKMVWRYGGRFPGVDDMCAGDVDGDGLLEFAVGFNGDGGVHLVGSNGKRRWKAPGGNVWSVATVDANGDGKLEIAHSGPDEVGDIAILDAAGKTISTLEIEPVVTVFSLCRYPGSAPQPDLLMADDGAIWLVGLDGKTRKHLPASPETGEGDAIGVAVKLRADQPEYLAVLEMSEEFRGATLYVFDSTGEIVYHEKLGERCGAIASLPQPGSATEQLLVGGNGRVLAFQAKGTPEQSAGGG